MTAGPPLKQIAVAEPLAHSGETVLSPEAWAVVKDEASPIYRPLEYCATEDLSSTGSLAPVGCPWWTVDRSSRSCRPTFLQCRWLAGVSDFARSQLVLVQVRGREIHHATGTYLCITELLVDIQPCRDKLVDYKVEESTVKPLMAR